MWRIMSDLAPGRLNSPREEEPITITVCVYIYIYMYMCMLYVCSMHIYIYIYIYVEREICMYRYIYIYIVIYVYNYVYNYIYIYIYIYPPEPRRILTPRLGPPWLEKTRACAGAWTEMRPFGSLDALLAQVICSHAQVSLGQIGVSQGGKTPLYRLEQLVHREPRGIRKGGS